MALTYTQRMVLTGIAVGVVIGVVVGGLGAYLGLSAGVRGGLTGAITVFALGYLSRQMRRSPSTEVRDQE
jgi:hypothetical protein